VSSVRWSVANNIVFAWIVTIPATAFIAALVYALTGLLG
jgi:PiT family inorganic phosphate transporter